MIGPHGVPVETPEVQHAKAAHFAAHAQARGALYSPLYHGAAPVVANGLPIDTPEVEAAKAHHFAAHAEALGRSGGYSGHYNVYPHAVIGHDGQPVETPEVQHAKAAHFAAHAAAHNRYY